MQSEKKLPQNLTFLHAVVLRWIFLVCVVLLFQVLVLE